PRLQLLASPQLRGLQGEALRDPVLERQFSLGEPLTDKATSIILAPSKHCHSWKQKAAREARASMESSGLELFGEIVSRAIAAWCAASLDVKREGSQPHLAARGRPAAYGEADGDFRWLPPVFVEHDRSPHAERQALLAVLSQVQSLQT
ncbi:unnamed protein product, partial [Polarella glacialis]